MNSSRPLVLIVDDNPTNIDLLVNTLKAEYRLGIAKNGPKALEYATKHTAGPCAAGYYDAGHGWLRGVFPVEGQS